MQLTDSPADERKADDIARLGSLEPGIDLGQWMREGRGTPVSERPEDDDDPDIRIEAGTLQGVWTWVHHSRPVDA
jgi:hypothetical protein